ncbi:MAG: hypothetical protein AAF202_10805, partial [Pseudomonadota bacterium]
NIHDFMADLLSKKMRAGQKSIQVEDRRLETGVRVLKQQRSFGDFPMLTVVYEVDFAGKKHFFEVDTKMSLFEDFQHQIVMLVQRIHVRSRLE